MSDDFDLVVIGCGAAGLSAAVSYAASAPGSRVAVLERSAEAERGGATRYTGAWFKVTEDRRLDPKFVGEMEEYSRGLADLVYCQTLEREVPTTLDFLEANGVNLIYVQQGFANNNTGGGLGMPTQGGLEIVDALAAVVEGTDGAEILYETEAVRLSVSDDGRVDGVVVRGGDGLLRRLGARAVVIASGGFEGNQRMLTQYLGERAVDMPLIAPGVGNNRGDGLRMVIDIGGDTSGQFDMFHAEPVDPRTSHPDAVLYGFPYGILVNGRAERFFDEGQDTLDETFEALGYEIWKHQDQTAFFIADQTFVELEGVEQLVLTDLPPVSAPTIAELAVELGLDPAALSDTVSRFNPAVGPGEFDPKVRDGKRTIGLDPPKSNWAYRIERAPYIAFPLTCAVNFTFGGVRTDEHARVVTPRGTPIPGLYAAGEVTGIYYHKYPVGTSVLRASTFGRLAGAHAAAAPT